MASDDREFDPLVDRAPSRYVVGIDLGTTNSAVTFVDTEETPWSIRVFSIPQLVAPGQVENRETLPSFHYQPGRGTVAKGALRLPWSVEDPETAVGAIARDEGSRTPGRMVASAKSWLCHAGVDRHADLLPWQGAADVDRLSPVEVSARYLRHVADAWNARFPEQPFSEQDVVLTLPASFDEVARELTIEAARRAGIPRVLLIEEPQAAFYSWVYHHWDDWEDLVRPGQKILVCDIGGGTSDFTLIRVRGSDTEEAKATSGGAGRVRFHRVAVGNHLILGGDNLDLALARHVEGKLRGEGRLDPRQWDVLLCMSRQVKETLLDPEAPPRLTVNLPGSGSRVIGGGVQVELEKREVTDLLVEGFLPEVALDSKPALRQSGFHEFGLPYASDPAITRYLAAFLTAHRGEATEDKEDGEGDEHDPARPDIVLFNGGFFASPVLRQRLLDRISAWFSGREANAWKPVVLRNDRLDLAVARGAAYYGMVRRGEGVRIAATLARSYYVGVAGDPPSAVCLVPGDAEPGQPIDSPEQTFQLAVSQPAEFPLFVSSTRLTDRPGDVVVVDPEQMIALPPIRTVLKTGRRGQAGQVQVRLHARLTEIGTIDLWCQETGSDRSWRLQFDVRAATQTDVDAHSGAAEQQGFVDESTWQACRQLIAEVFEGDQKPDGLPKRLGQALESDRADWPTSLLRRIWETLMEFEAGRRLSPVHEARWLNLLGYCLRPGFGLAVDDWRVAETWRIIRGKLAHQGPAGRNELLILWRRIAGGLSSGQQLAVAEPLLSTVRGMHQRFMTGKGGTSLSPAESVEIWRLLGSLELLKVPTKIQIGQWIVDLLPRKKLASVRGPLLWTLGRLGQRVPVHGPLNTVVPAETAETWLDRILGTTGDESVACLAAMQIARRTDDRHRDLSPKLREQTAAWLRGLEAPEHMAQLVLRGGALDGEEQNRVFGESLPRGLRLN